MNTKLWLARCEQTSCSCVVIFDHKPLEKELINLFCIKKDIKIKQVKLKDIVNEVL